MKMSMITVFLISISFAQLSHPVALVAAILAQTSACCVFLVFYNSTSWFSFILFLIFLGGLMVLFIYIASLASNEKFFLETKTLMQMAILSIMFYALIFVNMNDQTLMNNNINEMKMLMNMYMMNTMMVTAMTMIYLLLTLIIVVKMTSKYEGPLRNMIYNK